MDLLLGWLKSFRRAERVTAAEIRQRLAALRQQHHQTTTKRDRLALDAMGSDRAAEHYQRLGAEVGELTQQIQMLEAALPRAEQQEAEARAQADAIARTKRMQDYERQTAEAQAWLDALLARLPDGETLTAARDQRDRLHNEARALRAWSNDVLVRRPLDPLGEIHDALTMRVQRIERHLRWIHGDHPITLDKTPKAS